MENIFCLESHIHLCSRHTSAIPGYVIKTCVTWHAFSGTRYWGFVSPKLHVSTYRNQQHCWWFHYSFIFHPFIYLFIFAFGLPRRCGHEAPGTWEDRMYCNHPRVSAGQLFYWAGVNLPMSKIRYLVNVYIETVSAFSPASKPGRSNENPNWWRWHETGFETLRLRILFCIDARKS